MKTRIIIVSLAIVFVAIIVGCKKDEESSKTGQVTFSGTYGSKSTNSYTVTIDGKTLGFEESYPAPDCGTISMETALFTLSVGIHTYNATLKTVNSFDGHIDEYPSGPQSVTISEGTCISVRF